MKLEVKRFSKDHTDGMKVAVATIVGAYATTAYVISYTPTTGGETVENHKWVIQEEIKNSSDKPLKPGTEVTIIADPDHIRHKNQMLIF
ncbi:uncharacterized protein DUF1541 [Psychrobacillus insolitus]|uniref:Uncharacterized protein DUF1541 n=1 Tax=Psychrobacillus insolitus TaxID=1461 RepID=A0A2W7MZM1_9BACI|nr:uncharacterized protein DUF1541 [Psychrobacillus insolitus]